jgi:hypothetical protein
MSETILGLFCFLLILAALAGLLFLLAQLPSGDPEDANAIMRLLDSVSSGV